MKVMTAQTGKIFIKLMEYIFMKKLGLIFCLLLLASNSFADEVQVQNGSVIVTKTTTSSFTADSLNSKKRAIEAQIIIQQRMIDSLNAKLSEVNSLISQLD